MAFVWIDPKDFQPKTRLYADDLDEIVNDLYYLRDLITALWPVGVTIQYPAAGALPPNFLECNGVIYANTSWPALAAKLGNTWGGVPGSSFAVPDYRGRVPMGAGHGAGLTNRALGVLLGAETHALSLAELASHGHVQNAHNHTQNSHGHGVSDPGHVHSVAGGDFGDRIYVTWGAPTTHRLVSASNPDGVAWTLPTRIDSRVTGLSVNGQTAVNQQQTATNQSAGGGSGHNNVQPSAVTRFIIRAA